MQPATKTRRVWRSMKNCTNTVCSQSVSTVKKSEVGTPAAWMLRTRHDNRQLVTADTQLRSAWACVDDQRLPWERHLRPDRLTPYRVCRAFAILLLRLGTPASAPKPSGRA